MKDNYFLKYGPHFQRSIFSNEFVSHPLELSAHVHEDNTNSYRLNSDGYRTDEFTNNADLVAAGCSFTFGSGVPEASRWGSLVAKELGATETNLGVCAWSTHAIIQNIYAYFKKYGHPKRLLCLFPDTTRLPLSLVKGFWEYDDGFTEDDRQVVNVMLDRIEDYTYKDKPKYIKRPYQVLDILPVEVSLFFYVKYIQMLEDYCNAAGIEFYWSTWDRPMTEYLEASTHDFNVANHAFHGLKNYVPMNYSEWPWDTSHHGGGMSYGSVGEARAAYINECHGPSGDKDDNFFIGTDVEGIVHWGTHKHMHIAERFIASINAQ